MALVLLLSAAALAALCAAAVAWRMPDSTRPSLDVPAEAAAHRGVRRLVAARLDPARATGLWLSAALVVIIAGGFVLGVLAYLVRRHSAVVRFDNSVARWGNTHTLGFQRDVIEMITHVGAPGSIALLATAFGLALLMITREWRYVAFLACVIAGNALMTTLIKELAGRVRPDLNPVAATLGPSFPSGHSSHSAAFFAATALILGRGRRPHVRAVLAGAAIGLAVAVAASRVLLDEHWLSDVIAGLALGWAWFAVCAVAFGGRLLRFGAAARAARRSATGSARSTGWTRPDAPG
jgi:membrane-associated phospholipid phosphatase